MPIPVFSTAPRHPERLLRVIPTGVIGAPRRFVAQACVGSAATRHRISVCARASLAGLVVVAVNAMEEDLQRFVDAQARVIDRVRAELKAGVKKSHWMWFVFPQVKGLGHSETARRYAIHSRDEARAFLAHPVLGSRLRECTRLVLATNGKAIGDIFGPPDDLKFHSSMTLFAHATSEPLFRDVLAKYFAGEEDPETVKRL